MSTPIQSSPGALPLQNPASNNTSNPRPVASRIDPVDEAIWANANASLTLNREAQTEIAELRAHVQELEKSLIDAQKTAEKAGKPMSDQELRWAKAYIQNFETQIEDVNTRYKEQLELLKTRYPDAYPKA